MGKPVWVNGLPKEDGMYWMDPGLGVSSNSFVIQMHNNHGWLFGNGGSGPLDHYLPNEKIQQKAKFMKIPEPKKWVLMNKIDEKVLRCWVKTPKNIIGMGLFHWWGGRITADIAWLNDQHSASESGAWIRLEDNYQFCPVIPPKAKSK